MTPISHSSKCPSCGAFGTMSVNMTLVESLVAFTFCPSCEWKSWNRKGESLALSSILGLAAAR
jgi:hypothetical protein